MQNLVVHWRRGAAHGGGSLPRGRWQKETQFTRLVTRTKESNIYASVLVANQGRAMKVNVGPRRLARRRFARRGESLDAFEDEHICWDPKDGELCRDRVKPKETSVEARSGSDVQIDRQIIGKGAKD